MPTDNKIQKSFPKGHALRDELGYSNHVGFLPQAGAELFAIPWGHHKYIIDKCANNTEKALFYVRQTLKKSDDHDR